MRNSLTLRKLAITFAALSLGGSAFAADMAVKAPTPVTAQVYSWTGFYVGGNIGGAWGTARDTASFSQTDPGDANLATFGVSDRHQLNGIIGGAQAGYNWQVKNYLFGLETDIQASGQKGTSLFASTILANFGFGPSANAATVADSATLDWFGTVRGRLGYISNSWLFYTTGGLAYGDVRQNGNIQPANPPVVGVSNAPVIWNQSTIKVGWTIGVGVENVIAGNWSWKLEYLYMNLGNATANVSGGAPNCYAGGIGCGTFRNLASGAVNSAFADNIVRLGVNYNFK